MAQLARAWNRCEFFLLVLLRSGFLFARLSSEPV